MTRPAGWVKSISKSSGSYRVGSGGVVNLTDRIGLGQEVLTHGLGSGHPDQIRPARSELTLEKS